MARDVFVSYSQPDRDCAFELTRSLEDHGFTVWIAPRDVSPAAEWAEEIIDAIAAAKVMVLVFSASSNTSPQVRREVERAVHKDLRILPFRIEEVPPAKSLEYFLSSQHWLDGFPPPREPHYERLSACLRQWIPRTAERPAGSTSAIPITAPSSDGSPDGVGHGAVHGTRISTEQLRELETRLARIMGPIAGVLVDRAAADASDFAELERELAAQLDSPEDQRRFLQVRS